MTRVVKQLSLVLLIAAIAMVLMSYTSAGEADTSPRAVSAADDAASATFRKVEMAGEWPWQQADPKSTREAQDLRHIVDMLNGTWRLKQRTNPDGSVMKWEGTTIIDLKPYYPRFGALGPHDNHTPRALGTITVYETGIHDERCPECVPKEFIGQRGYVEANGTWTVDLLPDDHALYPGNGKDIFVAINDVTRIVGDHPPVDAGWNHNIMAYYRVPRGGDSVELLNQVGKSFFSPEGLPFNNNGEELGRELVSLSDCDVDQFGIEGDDMHIAWVWGGTDQWVRISD